MELIGIIEKNTTYLGTCDNGAFLSGSGICVFLFFAEHFGELFANGVKSHLTFIFLYFIFFGKLL